MCSMSVLCPLCAVPSFGSIDALQERLIKAANGPLACPFPECQELFLGLDKLTIHLFTHTSLMTSTVKEQEQQQKSLKQQQQNTPQLPQQQQQQQQQISATAVVKRKTKRIKTNKTITTTSQQPSIAAAATIISTQQQATPFVTAAVVNSPMVTCDICEFSFRDIQLRDMHFRLVHENVVDYNNSSITRTTADNDNNNIEPLKCHLCAKTFKMKGSLRLHLKVVHLMGLPYVNNIPKLNICDRIRHKEEVLQSTTTTTTQAINVVDEQEQQQQQPALLYATIGNTNSSSCSASSSLKLLTPPPPTPSNATAATASVLNINANGELVQSIPAANNANVLLVFNQTLTNATTPSPEPSEYKDGKALLDTNPKIWECDVCAKSFTTKYFLKKHKRLHTGEMPYTCELCARTFTFQQSYHKHLLYHSEVKPHVCAICGRAFKELSTLHNHERIHSGEKPFKCEVCGKCFRQRVSFLVHTRIHTGVMPYKCEFCQKSFRYKVSQRTHKCGQTNNAAPPQDLQTAPSNTLTHGEMTPSETLSDSFIKAFLEHNVASPSSGLNAALNEAQRSPASAEIAAITDADQALLTKAIDDIVVESCQKLGIDYTSNDGQCSILLRGTHECSSSPLDKLQNLRLYSPQLDSVTQSIGDSAASFGGFLLDQSDVNIL